MVCLIMMCSLMTLGCVVLEGGPEMAQRMKRWRKDRQLWKMNRAKMRRCYR